LSEFKHGYAAVIGTGGDLPVTLKDAQAVASMLCDPNRCAYPSSQVQLLLGKTANRDVILETLDKLVTQTQTDADATVIVYFSGHGIEIPDYFLVPYGFSLTNLESTAISGHEFTEKLNKIQARKFVLVLDCCHAGAMANTKGDVYIKSPVPPGLTNMLSQGSGRVMIASSRKDEKSWTGNPYSVFTTALLQGLAGYGASEYDGYARILDVTLWLGRMVPNRTNDKQHPIIKVSNLENNFIIAYYGGGEKDIKELDWTSSGYNTPPPNPETRHWRRLLDEYQHNLRIIEEGMARFVEFSAVPLQYRKEKQNLEAKIAELERKLRMR
jgi:hypothetical protein